MQRLLARAPGHGARRLTPLGLLPQGPPARALALALNAALVFGKLRRADLEPMAGRTVALEASDLGMRLRLGFDGERFAAASGEAPADVTVRSTASAFLALAMRREDPDTLFFTRRLLITGDTELGLVVKNALDAVDWSR